MAASTTKSGFCKCGGADNEWMIMCEAEQCQANLWYHFTCVGFLSEEELPEGQWICNVCLDLQGMYISIITYYDIGVEIFRLFSKLYHNIVIERSIIV